MSALGAARCPRLADKEGVIVGLGRFQSSVRVFSTALNRRHHCTGTTLSKVRLPRSDENLPETNVLLLDSIGSVGTSRSISAEIGKAESCRNVRRCRGNSANHCAPKVCKALRNRDTVGTQRFLTKIVCPAGERGAPPPVTPRRGTRSWLAQGRPSIVRSAL
jgi:hypothetical protein